jgi:hypothetical protein
MAISACLLGAACSGGALSKEDFVAQADEICAAAERQANDLQQPTDPSQAESYASELEEITQGYIADLRELEPPEADAEQVGSLIGKMEQAGLKIVEAIRTQSGSGNPAASYSEALHLAEEANEEAEAYGFESCGRSEILEHQD